MANILCVSHEWDLDVQSLHELTAAGYRIIPAANGYKAIREFAMRPIDAVIVNRRLPDIGIAELVRYFKQHNEALPVVMISTVMPPPEKVPEQVDAVIGKHHALVLLLPTLETLLEDRSLIHREAVPEDSKFPEAA